MIKMPNSAALQRQMEVPHNLTLEADKVVPIATPCVDFVGSKGLE